MTVTSGELNFQSKHHLICRIGKVKAARSVHTMADTAIKPKENIFYTQ